MGVSPHSKAHHGLAPRLLAVASGLILVGNFVALGTFGAADGQAADGATAGIGAPPTGDAGAGGSGGSMATAPPSAAGSSQAPTGGPTTSAPLPGVIKKDWDFGATLTPRCGLVGQRFTLTLQLGVNGTGVFSVVYGDGQTPGPKEFPVGGPDGSYSFTWTATAPPGDGIVIIAASDATHTNSGTKAIPFRIVGGTDRC